MIDDYDEKRRCYELSQEGNKSNLLLIEAQRKDNDGYKLFQECDNQKEMSILDLGSSSNLSV